MRCQVVTRRGGGCICFLRCGSGSSLRKEALSSERLERLTFTRSSMRTRPSRSLHRPFTPLEPPRRPLGERAHLAALVLSLHPLTRLESMHRLASRLTMSTPPARRHRLPLPLVLALSSPHTRMRAASTRAAPPAQGWKPGDPILFAEPAGTLQRSELPPIEGRGWREGDAIVFDGAVGDLAHGALEQARRDAARAGSATRCVAPLLIRCTASLTRCSCRTRVFPRLRSSQPPPSCYDVLREPAVAPRTRRRAPTQCRRNALARSVARAGARVAPRAGRPRGGGGGPGAGAGASAGRRTARAVERRRQRADAAHAVAGRDGRPRQWRRL